MTWGQGDEEDTEPRTDVPAIRTPGLFVETTEGMGRRCPHPGLPVGPLRRDLSPQTGPSLLPLPIQADPITCPLPNPAFPPRRGLGSLPQPVLGEGGREGGRRGPPRCRQYRAIATNA